MDLFELSAQTDAQAKAPLADRMRPQSISEVVGQGHLLGAGHLLRTAIESDRVPSLIFWGPPGTGKTTLAQVVARSTGAHFHALSAVMSGVKDIKEAISQAEHRWTERRQRTLLFVDEIHRFNKAQQDALLPHVEKGTVTLLGATTENPSFEINAALLSRTRVLTLKSIEEADLITLLRRACADERGLKGRAAEDAALTLIARTADGDARRALTMLEVAAQNAQGAEIDLQAAQEAVQTRTLLYDAQGDEHYNVVSAFIKSMRASDVDAAVYWLARMLEAGEDPNFVCRRMAIFASEDIGNAEPRALGVAMDAWQAFERIGIPEGVLPLTQAVTFLSLAPKSNAALTTYAAVKKSLEHGALPVPLHLRNAPTSLMKSLGFGSGYQYPHDFEGNYVPGNHLPNGIQTERFYFPSENGEERALKEKYERLRALKAPREPGENG